MPFAVLVREAGAEEGAAGFLGGFKVAHEVFHESDGEGKFLFRGMRFPFGNEVPGLVLVVEVVAADFLEFPHLFDADEETHVFPDGPGIVHEALAARSFAAEAAGRAFSPSFTSLVRSSSGTLLGLSPWATGSQMEKIMTFLPLDCS